jgi:hypothetical protein
MNFSNLAKAINRTISSSYESDPTPLIIGWFVILGAVVFGFGFVSFAMIKDMDHIFNHTHRADTSREIMVIGITGRKRSGKDTVGKYLVDNHRFIRVAYADALKEACKIIFGFSDEQVYGDDLKEVEDEYWKHSPREVLQKVGTELFRERLPEICANISNDIWIRSVDRQIQHLRKQGHTRFVVTDARFPNELDFITKYKGVTWKIQRPSIIVNTSDVHASETMIDELKCDTDIVNDRSHNDLYNDVEVELNKIFAKIQKM